MPILFLIALLVTADAGAQDRPLRQMRVPALVTAIAFAPDGEHVVAWDPAGFSRWNVERGRTTAREGVFAKACGRAPVLPRSDDGVVIGGNCKGKLVLFEVATAKPLGEWQSPKQRVPVVFTASPDAKLIATVMAGTLTVVDVSTPAGEAAAPPLQNQQEVELLTFSPSGRHLGAGAVGSVRLWSLPDGQSVRTIEGGPSHAFHPDGTSIAIAETDGVGLFAVADGIRVREFTGGVSQVRFGPGGRWLVGWTNQQVTVWDAASGEPRVTMKGNEFVGAAVSPDGTRLATLSVERRGDATASVIAIWRLP